MTSSDRKHAPVPNFVFNKHLYATCHEAGCSQLRSSQYLLNLQLAQSYTILRFFCLRKSHFSIKILVALQCYFHSALLSSRSLIFCQSVLQCQLFIYHLITMLQRIIYLAQHGNLYYNFTPAAADLHSVTAMIEEN